MRNKIISVIVIFITNIIIAQTNPKVEKQDIDNCIITKIETNLYNTIVYFKYPADQITNSGGWVCAGPNFFIEDANTGKRFEMIKANNIPICPEKHEFTNGEKPLEFNVVFEPINKTNKINVIENELERGFNFYGVELETSSSEFINTESTTVYFIISIILSLLVNIFFRGRVSIWWLFLVVIISNFIIGMLAKYILVKSEFEYVFINFTNNNIANQFFESIGCALVVFIFISFFFRIKKQNITISNSKNSFSLTNQFKKIPKGIYRIIIVGWIILPVIMCIIVSFKSFSHNILENTIIAFFSCIFIYYLLVSLSIWVYLGFQKEESLPENTEISEIPIDNNNANSISKYASIILSFFLFLSVLIILTLFDQISYFRVAKDKQAKQVKALNESIITESLSYKIHSLVGSKTESENYTTSYLELTVENKLNIPVNISISRVNIKGENIKWENFNTWTLEPNYRGSLSIDNEILKVGGYCYYVMDKNGSPILGSEKRPVYTTIFENIGELVIF